jgi:hypothetical protein
MAQVPPDPVNPDPGDVPDRPNASATVNLNATVYQTIQDLKAQRVGWLKNANLPGTWMLPIRILKESGNTASQAAGKTGRRARLSRSRAASYMGIKAYTPKKSGKKLQVNADARDIKRQSIAFLRQHIHDTGLEGQFRSIVRICPLRSDGSGNQDDSNCGCGCAS